MRAPLISKKRRQFGYRMTPRAPHIPNSLEAKHTIYTHIQIEHYFGYRGETTQNVYIMHAFVEVYFEVYKVQLIKKIIPIFTNE